MDLNPRLLRPKRAGDPISAADWNALVAIAARQVAAPVMISDSQGTYILPPAAPKSNPIVPMLIVSLGSPSPDWILHARDAMWTGDEWVVIDSGQELVEVRCIVHYAEDLGWEDLAPRPWSGMIVLTASFGGDRFVISPFHGTEECPPW